MEKYLLHINEPCTENWESMSTAEQGKFCSQCNKTVFDFTTATDAEIVKHIEAMKGELFCGRFEENQLDRWIERSDIKTSNPRLYKFLISFMLLGAAQGANAQTIPVQEKVAMQRKLDSLLNIESTKAERAEMVCDTIAENGGKKVGTERVLFLGKATTVSSNQPVFILDGHIIKQASLTKVDPKKITNITILEPSVSKELYGWQGIKGGVVITSSYTQKQLKKILR